MSPILTRPVHERRPQKFRHYEACRGCRAGICPWLAITRTAGWSAGRTQRSISYAAIATAGRTSSSCFGPLAGDDAAQAGEHLAQLRGDRVLLPGEVLDLAAGRAGGELGLAAGLARAPGAPRRGRSLHRLVRERTWLLDGVGRVPLGLDAARLGPLLDLLGALLGGAGALLGLADQLLLVLATAAACRWRLLALGLLAPLGELERERLQVLVAACPGLGVQLGRLGALLLGLAGGLARAAG